ncbi:MAG: repeat containing protein [Gemmatimonadetes bacterium]|nr:repeat containing protein [Gemmatimonadota bacterium]
MLSRRASMTPALALIALVSACGPDATRPARSPDAAALDRVTAEAAAQITVYASGFAFPRGLTFGPDGLLYVAEAGSGGTEFTTAHDCEQVVPPVGPYVNGPTGRISRVDTHGVRETVASGFPSASNKLGDVIGVADVAFVGQTLYALSAGGGCSHGSSHVPSGVARVESSGAWTTIADFSAWQRANPVANPEEDDFEPDGTWYSMIEVRGSLIAIEPNHGEIVSVEPSTGAISRIVDVSASQGHVVPTVSAFRHGDLYVSALGVFPIVPGSENIYRVTLDGALTIVAHGFTTVLGIDFDRAGQMYVLESSPVAGFPIPGAGRVVQVDLAGNRTIIADHLIFPTALRFGPDGALYVSNKGYGPPESGEVLRIVLPTALED